MLAFTGNIANLITENCIEGYICTGALDESKPTSRFLKPKQQQNAVRRSSYHNCKCLQQFMWVQRLTLMLTEFLYCQIVSLFYSTRLQE